MSNIMHKLGVDRRVEAATVAHRADILAAAPTPEPTPGPDDDRTSAATVD